MGVRLAAKRWEAQHTRHIEDCIAQQEKAVNELEFSQLDISMHEYIMTCSGNERLLTLWQYIRWQFEMALVTIHQLLGKRTLELRSVAIAGHWKVLESLTARKAEQAAKTMAQHIVRALEWSVPEDVEPTPTPSTARRRQSRSEGA
jgi:DNA-binding FadR family transcriptional regulator